MIKRIVLFIVWASVAVWALGIIREKLIPISDTNLKYITDVISIIFIVVIGIVFSGKQYTFKWKVIVFTLLFIIYYIPFAFNYIISDFLSGYDCMIPVQTKEFTIFYDVMLLLLCMFIPSFHPRGDADN